MTHSQVMSLMGLKFYRQEDDDKFEILRITNIKGTNECVCKFNDGREEILLPEFILSNYTKLIPDGLITFAIVSTMVDEQKEIYTDDVMILVRTIDNIKNNCISPDLICRQYIKDIFGVLSGHEDNQMVGLSICRTEVPRNMSMEMITHCDKINYIVNYNTYISDTPKDFIDFMKGKRLKRFNDVLENGFIEYIRSKNIPDSGQKIIKGRCRDLESLMRNNNFYYDYDTIYNITPLDINVEENLEEKEFSDGTKYVSLNSYLTNIFSNVFKMKISKTVVVKYDHDIDLSEFENGTIMLIRSNDDTLYVVRYTSAGNYLESELELDSVVQAMEHIKVVNKYKKSKS